MSSPILFFCEDVEFGLNQAQEVSTWIQNCISEEGKELEEINYIFCSDKHLHSMNVEYLNHDTLTDVITFDLSDNQEVNSEIYISIERVKDNAKDLSTEFETELHRVMIHGVLHLLGYRDKSPEDQSVMRQKEDYYLTLRTFF